MKLSKWSLIKVCLFIIIFIQACKSEKQAFDSLPYYNDASFTPHWISSDDPVLDTFHKVSPFNLKNQLGEIVNEKTFDNKIYVTDFFFTTCPGICPKMMDNMQNLQEVFADDKDFLLLSHSVTPERDTVEVLRKYADERGVVDSKWHLVTGDRREIYTMGRYQYFIEEDMGLERDPDEFLHTENFVLIDKRKYIRGIYNGLNQSSMKQLIEDVRILQREG